MEAVIGLLLMLLRVSHGEMPNCLTLCTEVKVKIKCTEKTATGIN